MSKLWLLLTAVMLGTALAAACSDDDDAENAAGNGHTHGIIVADAWARETAGNTGENSVVYVLLTNDQHDPDRLVAASVPPAVASRAALHTTMQDGDTLRMVPVEGWDLDGDGGKLALEPGGHHIMLLDVPSRLEAGQTFVATLTFEHAGNVEAQVEVRTVAGASAGGKDAEPLGDDHDHAEDAADAE